MAEATRCLVTVDSADLEQVLSQAYGDVRADDLPADDLLRLARLKRAIDGARDELSPAGTSTPERTS